MYNNIKYFKGLNSLRFLAAYFVLLHHAEQIRMKYGMFNCKSLSIFNNGGISVTFFFVLSGFLITYLLLKEQKQTGDIAVKKFYVRRILRIWPLYFLLVFIGTVAFPFALQFVDFSYEMPYRFSQVILYFIFFMPFMVNIIYGHNLLEPLWSIGVEELFYLGWAPLFKFLKKHVLKIIFAVIFIKVGLLLFVHCVEVHSYVESVVNTLKFEAMAIGGLGAYLIFNRKKDISHSALFSLPVQVLMLVFFILRFGAYRYLVENYRLFDWLFSTYIISELLLMCVFAWLIINVSLNSRSIVKLNNKALNFLGEISYGVYMYHMLIISGIVFILRDFLNGMNALSSSLLFYTLATGGVILVSYLSKIWFEDRFLRLKKKFG